MYNTAVVNVNTTVVHNTYVDRTVINNTTINNNHYSFNGEGGVNGAAHGDGTGGRARKSFPADVQPAFP